MEVNKYGHLWARAMLCNSLSNMRGMFTLCYYCSIFSYERRPWTCVK